MPATTDLNSLLSRLGWKAEPDEDDLDDLIAHQGAPSRRVTADSILSVIATQDEIPQEATPKIIPFHSPSAEGLARAARNGEAIPEDIERRMAEDKQRARAERDAGNPKP
ncbi:hypothetical protein LBMAG53_19950 [Planctomycetota bacterium]|nr:hypothetical protein LBMAG53_19950 [Planctomycetota bacterium]